SQTSCVVSFVGHADSLRPRRVLLIKTPSYLLFETQNFLVNGSKYLEIRRMAGAFHAVSAGKTNPIDTMTYLEYREIPQSRRKHLTGQFGRYQILIRCFI
ncbi:hypothetical protein, partial [Burkholderia pseudomallei]